jgi:hypothetical protein
MSIYRSGVQKVKDGSVKHMTGRRKSVVVLKKNGQNLFLQRLEIYVKEFSYERATWKIQKQTFYSTR